MAQNSSTICADQTICLGEIVELDCACLGESFEGNGVYQENGSWFFSSVQAGVGVHVIAAPCGIDVTEFWLTVTPYPDITILPQNPQICQGESVQLTASGIQSGGTWLWSPATGLNSTTSANVIASPTQTTTYTVTGTNADVCSSSAEVTVTVNPTYTLFISANDDEICPGEEVVLTFGGGPLGTTYELHNSNSVWYNQYTNTTVSVFPTSTVTYWVELLNTTCYIQDEISITVNEAPQLSVMAQPTVICVGQSAFLTAVTDPGNTISWNPAATLSASTGLQVLATPLATTTYTATATNADGCVSEMDVLVIVEEVCCVADNQPPTYLITQNTPDWIGQSYTLNQDLVVSAGVDFVINNCTLKFASDKGIILQEGADLSVINNSKLTLLDLCDPFWKGISSQRVSNYITTTDKNLITISSSIIEFAQTGLSLQTIDSNAPNTTTHWVQVTCSNVLFNNNARDLWIRGQTPTVTAYPNVLGQFTDCDFLLTSDFPVTYLPSSSKCHIQNLAKAILFNRCEFRNEVPAILTNFEFVAMVFRNAPVNVHNYAPNNTGMGNSQSLITGFTRGISGTGIGSINLVGTDFANWRSAYFWMRGKHLIEDNDFYCLTADIFNGLPGAMFIQSALSPITQESLDITIAPYGLYMDGPDGVFNVIDNHFETTIPGYGTAFSHGMIANNTGDNPNRVRRNVFTNMQRALKIQGDNRTNDYQDGLKYSCNFFEFNDSDIREVNSTVGNPNTFGVPFQFTLIQPQNLIGDPANNFTQSSSNCSPCGFDDLSNVMTSSMANHRYYREDSSQEPSDEETSPAPNVVIVPVENNVDPCESSTQFVVGGSSLQDLMTSLSLNTLALDELQIGFNQLVDGGNTSELIQMIQSAQYSNALELYYSLLLESPNLSEEVMLEALDKLELPNILLTQILASNPHASKSGRIGQAIDSRPVPFDEYQKNQISLGLSQFSSLENLQGLIAGIAARRSEILHELFSVIDNTEDQNKLQTKLSLLEVDKYFSDLQLQAILQQECGEYLTSAGSAAMAFEYHKLLPEEESDINAWSHLMQIYHLRSTDLQGFEITVDQRDFLYNCLVSTSSWVCMRALELLKEEDEFEYWEPLIEDDETRLYQGLSGDQNLRGHRAFPNPTKDLVQLIWTEDIFQIEVLNSFGQTVLIEVISDFRRQAVLDFRALSLGVYFIRFYNRNGEMSEELIIKQ